MSIRTRRFFIAAFTIAISAVAISTASDAIKPRQQHIAGWLETNQDTALFTQALRAANLWDDIVESKEVTIFLPRDQTLRDEGSAFLLEVVLLKPANIDRLRELMAQHIFPDQTINLQKFGEIARYSNALGGCVSIEPTEGSVTTVGSEAVVVGSQLLGNGNIYFIDRLISQQYEGTDTCLK